MLKGLNTNRTLNIFFTLIFIVVLIFLLIEIQKPHNSKEQTYATSYLFFEKINVDQLIILKSIILSFTVVFPIFIGASYLIRNKIEETPSWFLLALLILLAAGIYLTFLI